MIISDHARKAMLNDGITEEEIKACIEHGEREIKQLAEGEVRYGNKLELKNKTIIVIYTYRDKKTRVITCYIIQRKKW